jgi:hypothetical protein
VCDFVNYSYCDGLLEALKYGTRKSRVTRSTIEIRLLSNEVVNNDNKRGTTEDLSYATVAETGSYRGDAKENPSRR